MHRTTSRALAFAALAPAALAQTPILERVDVIASSLNPIGEPDVAFKEAGSAFYVGNSSDGSSYLGTRFVSGPSIPGSLRDMTFVDNPGEDPSIAYDRLNSARSPEVVDEPEILGVERGADVRGSGRTWLDQIVDEVGAQRHVAVSGNPDRMLDVIPDALGPRLRRRIPSEMNGPNALMATNPPETGHLGDLVVGQVAGMIAERTARRVGGDVGSGRHLRRGARPRGPRGG